MNRQNRKIEATLILEKTGKKSWRQRPKKLAFTVSSGILIGLVLAPTMTTAFLPTIIAKADVLNIEILSNITSSNDSATSPSQPYAAGTKQNVNFSISGSAPVEARVLTGTRYAVLVIPKDLRGKVAANGAASGKTSVTVDLTKVGILTDLFKSLNNNLSNLTQVVNTVVSTTGLSLDTTQFYQSLNALQSIQNIGNANFTAASSLSADGSMMKVNLDTGLGPILAQNVINLLQNLMAAINGLNVKVTSSDPLGTLTVLAKTLNGTLSLLKALLNPLVNNVLTPITSGTGELLQELVTVSVLGSTNLTIPTSITVPSVTKIQKQPTQLKESTSQVLEEKFVGTVVQSDTLDVNVLSTANGVSSIYIEGPATTVTAPTAKATGNSKDGYTVTGTADPNTTITIKDDKGNILATTTTDASGNYSVTLPASVGAEVTLTATASNAKGTSEPTSFQTPADSPSPVVPDAPIVNSITGNSTDGYVIKGSAEPNSTITVIDSTTGKILVTTTVGADGNYSLTIPAGSASANEPLTLTATNGEGTSSPTTIITPADPPTPVAPAAPIVDSITGSSKDGYIITGTAEPNSTITVSDSITSKTLASSSADSTGKFSVTLPIGSAIANESLNVIASNASGSSAPTKVMTPADPPAPTVPAAPVVISVTGDSKTGYTVTGTADPNTTINIKDNTGQLIATTKTDSLGNYTLSLPASVGQNASLIATASNANGTSEPTNFQTPADLPTPVVPDVPVVDSITGNSKDGYTITGTAEPNSIITVIDSATGSLLASTIVDGNGKYSVILLAGSVTANESLNIIATNGAGSSSPISIVTPADPPVPVVPDAPLVNSITGNSKTGYTITGSAESNSTIRVTNPETGKILATATVDVKGNYSVKLPVGSVHEKEKISLTASNSAGVSASTIVTIPADPIQPTKVVYRLYNPYTGEHFYPTTQYERDQDLIKGWRNEGQLETAPTSGKPIYRIYNPNVPGGDHYYTMSKYEAQTRVNEGWKWDNNGQPVFYSGGSKPVYVAYNPNARSGAHSYTMSAYEQNQLLKIGWKFGATAWMAVDK